MAHVRPQTGFLTLVSGTHGSLTFSTGISQMRIAASADCTLTYKIGQTTDPGSVPASGTVTADLGVIKMLAGQEYIRQFWKDPSTTIAFKQSSGSNVDITVEGDNSPIRVG